MKIQYLLRFLLIAILLTSCAGLSSELDDRAMSNPKVDINSATQAELMTVSGMTEEVAQGIIDGRPFLALDELLIVDGMTEELLSEMRDSVDVTAPEAQGSNQERKRKGSKPGHKGPKVGGAGDVDP